MDLLSAEHGVGKRHRSQQTRTKLEEPRCAAEGEGGEEGRIGQPGARGRRACQGAPGPGSQVPSLEPGRGRGSGAGPGSRIRNQVGAPGLNWARPGRQCLPGFGVGPRRGGGGGSQIWRGAKGPASRGAGGEVLLPLLRRLL